MFLIFWNFALAMPNQALNSLQDNEATDTKNDDVLSEISLRKVRAVPFLSNYVAAYASWPFQLLGIRGDWRFCRNTPEGASIYTNGIDVVCRGICIETEITCNDYYRPYA